MTKRNIVDLPEDLLMEILARVPTVSLVRLQSTSKRWNVLIEDKRFAEQHFTNAPRHSLLIMLMTFRVYLVSVDLHTIHNNKVNIISQLRLKDPLSNFLEEVDICNVFHCDGFLLCTTVDNRLVVSNPCSRDTKWIQPRNFYKKFDIFAPGKSSCNKYKIMRMDEFYYYDRPENINYEIYDFNSNSWRVVGKITDWFIPRCMDRGMSVNGNTYWLASTNKDLTSSSFLLGFDFSTERFVRVSLPGDHLSDPVFALAVTREDPKICVAIIQELHIDVWIATTIESTGAASWSKFLSVELANLYERICLDSWMNFLVDQKNKVLVYRDDNYWISNVFLHVVGEDKCIQVDHHDSVSRCSLVVNYVPTLVHI
ncbi:putative F-box protein [Arabidopsis thaliana]